jgi:hypothetical protein
VDAETSDDRFGAALESPEPVMLPDSRIIESSWFDSSSSSAFRASLEIWAIFDARKFVVVFDVYNMPKEERSAIRSPPVALG